MLKVIEAVQAIVEESEIASSSLRDGYLNLAAYARDIRREVETRTKKTVGTGTIVVSLSRLRVRLRKTKPLVPKVAVHDVALRSDLTEITYSRTPETLHVIKQLYQDRRITASDYLLVSQGTAEITLIVNDAVVSVVQQLFLPWKPKKVIPDLASLTVRFSEDYIPIPNIMYALMRRLALHYINVVEIVSTYTELTFVVFKKDVTASLSALTKL